jgi:stearoyl-CoA desaturase (delta-9 desaturase)
MTKIDEREVYRLPTRAYIQRAAYFSVTTLIVIAGTYLAVGDFLASPVDALYVLPITFTLIALGVNTGYHMYFSHQSFDATPAFKSVLACLGTIACQDSVVQWASNHKRHHRYTDQADLDPHTPHQFGDSKWTVLTVGLIWATGAWKYSRTSTSKTYYGKQLLNDPVIRWFDKYFVPVSYSGFVIPFVLGYTLGGMELAIKWFAYFGAFRVFAGYFFTEFVVNALCHSVGTRKFETKGHSFNLSKVSWLTLGTSLHHNHHAFPRALSPAIDGEWDPMNIAYKFLKKIGVMSNPRTATKQEVEQKRLRRRRMNTTGESEALIESD